MSLYHDILHRFQSASFGPVYPLVDCTDEEIFLLASSINYLFYRLHDRKLCVLGLCQLLSMAPTRPPVLNDLANVIIPSLILLFDGLKRAYVGKSVYHVLEELLHGHLCVTPHRADVGF